MVPVAGIPVFNIVHVLPKLVDLYTAAFPKFEFITHPVEAYSTLVLRGSWCRSQNKESITLVQVVPPLTDLYIPLAPAAQTSLLLAGFTKTFLISDASPFVNWK